MIEITSPDAMGIVRIKVDGVARYSIVPRELRVAEGTEYCVYPTDMRMSGVRYCSTPERALEVAMDRVARYYL